MKIGAISKIHQMPVRRAKLAGFTLTELLITVAIVAVLATIAVPSYREFIAGQRIKTASFDLMAVLTLARSEAIKRNNIATITPAGGAWANGWSVTAPDGTILNQQSALTGLTITCAGGCPGSVAYAGNGRLTPTPATALTFQIGSAASAQMRCISIDPSGRPNAKSGSC